MPQSSLMKVGSKSLTQDDRNIAFNALAGLIIKGGAIVVNFLMLRFYMKYFQNSTVLGAWLTILSVLNWILMFDLGIGNGLRNILPNAIKNKDYVLVRQYISSAYFFLAAILMIFGTVVFFLIPSVNWNEILNVPKDLIRQEVLCHSMRIVFLGMILQLFLKILQSILYAFQKAWIVSFLTLLSNCVIMIAVFVMNNQSDESNLLRMSYVNVVAVNLPLLIATIVVFTKMMPQCVPNPSFYVKEYAVSIFKEGLVLLWLTIIFMVISSTNEFLISYLTKPDNVVVFQAYNKVYSGISALFVVMLTPIWSAVTKAKVEMNYAWIQSLYKRLLILSLGCLLINLLIIPILQWVMNIWLGESTIEVNSYLAVIFSVSSYLFVVHNVNTSFGNGFSYYKTQSVWMSVAALINIPLAVLLVRLTGDWIGVVIANIIALVPYNILAPIQLIKQLNSQERNREAKQK